MKKSLNQTLKRSIIVIAFLMIFLSLVGMTSSGQTLAENYAPILYFEAEETCYPINASYHIDNSQYTCIDQFSEETCFYDNTHGTINDDGIINHYQSVKNSYGYTVYYRVYSYGIIDVIQYWFFYAFNKGELNQHEGDWEMVQVVLENNEPSKVAYSQHHSGQWGTWNQVEKEGNHIKVYVARGSHANYLRSYSGKLGIASDIVGANGLVLNPSDYTLNNVEYESWIDFSGRWGEVADTESDAYEAQFLGQAGPEGPKYRTTQPEGISLWDDPAEWGESLMQANDIFFTLEWFLYNFVTIFILITLVIIALLAYRIYRRRKKYGLGPRIVSMFYINGFNLHSIGNILCIVGIILAFIGLFNPWYVVSYGVSGTGISETFQTEGMTDLFNFDGINGLQITVPGASGPTPIGSLVLPFSLFIGIGLIFLIIATIGIPLSKKLGGKYIWRGARLIIPFILIIIVIAAIGSLISSFMPPVETGTNYVQNIFGSISGSPFGGESTTTISETGVTGQINLQWGLGMGGWLLLIAGIILLIAGILELMSKTQFFATKMPLPGQVQPPMPGQAPPAPPRQPPVQQPPPPPPAQPPADKKKAPPKGKPKTTFCGECGAKLEENATFCVKCGKKLGK